MLRPIPRVVRLRPPTKEAPSRPLPMLAGLASERGELRVLDFDIENRPLSYWYDGKSTAEITAIAWWWIGEDAEPECYCLDRRGRASAVAMLEAFSAAYAEADLVTGHYIRRHDLPIIQAALVELELPLLGAKLSSDTRLDLVKFSDIAKSQEALGAMLGLESPKVGMTQSDWREANRLTADGIDKTRGRVIGDVVQHAELRAALLERGLLRAPRTWRP
jgi:hypothetical protein